MFKMIRQFISSVGRAVVSFTRRVIQRAKPSLMALARRVGVLVLELLIAKIVGPAPVAA